MHRFFRSDTRSARTQLWRRLEREQTGEEAYKKMIAHHDDRPFKIFGLVFILAFAAIVLGVAGMEA